LDHVFFMTLWIVMMFVLTGDRAGDYTDSVVDVRALEVVCFTCGFGHVISGWRTELAWLSIHNKNSGQVWNQVREKPAKLFGFFALSIVIFVRVLTVFPHAVDVASTFQLYQVLVCFISATVIIQILQYFVLVDKNLGALILTVLEMFLDSLTFFFLFLVVLVATSVCFLGLTRMGFFTVAPEFTDDFHPRGALVVPLWASFANVDLSESTDNSVGQWLTVIYLWLYTFVSSILLFNLLIAMFSATYERLMSNATTEVIWFKWELLMTLMQNDWLSPPSLSGLPLLRSIAVSCAYDSLGSFRWNWRNKKALAQRRLSEMLGNVPGHELSVVRRPES